MKRLPTASIAYVGAALVMGALNAIRSGADIGSAGGIGFALNRGPLLGLVIGGGRRLFAPALYCEDRGVEQDAVQAMAWAVRLAEEGNAVDRFLTGNLYASGECGLQDDREALKWYQRAAEAGHPGAQYAVGLAFYHGRSGGIDSPDYGFAFTWINLAAQQNMFSAQATLGHMFAEGLGVVQDYVEAHKWFNLAAAALDGREREEAVRLRDALVTKMTREDVSEAQRLARERIPVSQ